MWLIVSLTERAVIAFYYDRKFCEDALTVLKHYKPDYFDKARLVPYFVSMDEFQHFLNPIIMECLDKHNIVIS